MPASVRETSSISQVGGVWAAAITPARESGHEIDLGGALEVIDYLQDFDLSGIVLLGSTGELIHFDLPERSKLIQMALKRSRKPILASVTHSTLAGTVLLADEALSAGATGVVVMPPYYFRYSQDDLRSFFVAVADELGHGASVFLYNIPQFSTPIDPETAVELLEAGSFAGIKDSSGSPENFARLGSVRNRDRLRLMIGNDAMLVRGRQAGADGVVSGVAMMAPELILALDSAAVRGDAAALARLEPMLAECLDWLDRLPVPVGIKLACAGRRLRAGALAVPPNSKQEELHNAFRNWLSDWLPRACA